MPWLRPITKATSTQAADALATYHDVPAHLATVYARGGMDDAGQIVAVRSAMMKLDAEAEKVAASGLGVPFF